MFFFKVDKEKVEKELEGLQKAFEILDERYKKKSITLEQFTAQCADLTKKIEKCRRKLNK